MRRRFCAILAVSLAASMAAAPQTTSYSEIDLVAEQATIPADGGRITLGLALAPKPGWHAYWLNPGDAGKAPEVDWQLPDGWQASALQFPPPHAIPFHDFMTYGYHDSVMLLADIDVPAGLPDATVSLSGRASWVVCDDELCVPEEAAISLELPVGDGSANPDTADAFAAARAALPASVDWPAHFAVADSRVSFDVETPVDAALPAELYVANRRTVRYDEQSAARTPTGFRFDMAAGARVAEQDGIDAVVRYSAGGESRTVGLTFAQVDVLPEATSRAPGAAIPVATAEAGFAEVVIAIVFGLLGGMLLNLMPCVFPILSLKALGLAEMSEAGASESRRHGLFYTAGVLATFLGLAVLLIVLRHAGAAVGWGFQLQSPWVNLVLALVMVGVGLNLAGVFEIGTRAMGVGQNLTSGTDAKSSFWTGALAVVVATPCTAPFMAGALGFALVQPIPVALAVFAALGLGLALPYLALSFVPALAKALPRPGAWMSTFRHVLAFPMFGTALWLTWVIGQQSGATAMAVALLAALVASFALWAYGHSQRGGKVIAWRVTAAAALMACVAASQPLWPRDSVETQAAAGNTERLGLLEAEPFTPDVVAAHVASRAPTFVYFTADWCISCKVNERVALATDTVGNAFRDRGIKVVKADWTTEDPTITEWLTKYDRAGVPLYLYFPAGATLDDAAVLPQVLLPDIVIDAIDAADAELS